jgi:3-deoxy-D-manno-octulosonic-acid transferase
MRSSGLIFSVTHILYNLSVSFFSVAVRAVTPFSSKTKLWVEGRRDWKNRYRQSNSRAVKTLWMHVSSLGEFEQGRPVLERFREDYPDWQIVLSFFSPSGYEIRKNYPGADRVVYLPADTPGNARVFLDLIRPDLAVFVKYDFWFNYLSELSERKIPTLLVSALFRKEQPFFRWYGDLWRRMLTFFDEIQVQNLHSAELLKAAGYENTVIAGDTRVDRVLALAASARPNERVAAFTSGNRPVFIAGSSWEADENVFLPVMKKEQFSHLLLIIAPHAPSERNVERLLAAAPGSVRYSEYDKDKHQECKTLIIDNVGMLNTLYQYAHIAWIGGGFGKSIHNTLEPAAYGLPLIYGPAYRHFEEAVQFAARGGALVVRDSAGVEAALTILLKPEGRIRPSEAVLGYLNESKGATDTAMRWFVYQTGVVSKQKEQ